MTQRREEPPEREYREPTELEEEIAKFVSPELSDRLYDYITELVIKSETPCPACEHQQILQEQIDHALVLCHDCKEQPTEGQLENEDGVELCQDCADKRGISHCETCGFYREEWMRQEQCFSCDELAADSLYEAMKDARYGG